MRFERLTLKAQEALQTSQELARTYGHGEIRPLHLLLALARQQEGIVAPILEKLGADPRAVAASVEDRLRSLPRVQGASDLALSRAVQDVFDAAEAAAREFQDEFVSTEHLLLAMVRGRGE